jgi:protoporphyrinogen oxidase
VRARRDREVRVVIIGAGLAGLSTAWHLDRLPAGGPLRLGYRILEKEGRPGGLCRTERAGEFLFDYSGHLIHSRNPYFGRLFRRLLAGNLAAHRRRAFISYRGRLVRYPFQANLHGLPVEVIEECLYEFARTHFARGRRQRKNFGDWIEASFGKGIARHFMVPYNRKLWRLHPRRITCDWLGRFVPAPDLRRAIRGAVGRDAEMGYNASFHYPRRGGIESLPRALASQVRGQIVAGAAVKKIDLAERRVFIAGGDEPFDYLVSTMPLKQLVASLTEAPRQVSSAARRLRHVSVLNVNVGFTGQAPAHHWLYLPEAGYLPYRAGIASNFARDLAPEGHASAYAEVSYLPGQRLDWEACASRVLEDLQALRLFPEGSQVREVQMLDIPYAYVLYDAARRDAVSCIQKHLRRNNVFSIGRFGGWEYSSMEDAVLAGRDAAAAILSDAAKPS